MNVHVVCHDCPFESVEPTKPLAKYLRDMHHLMKNHDVEWKVIGDGA